MCAREGLNLYPKYQIEDRFVVKRVVEDNSCCHVAQVSPSPPVHLMCLILHRLHFGKRAPEGLKQQRVVQQGGPQGALTSERHLMRTHARAVVAAARVAIGRLG